MLTWIITNNVLKFGQLVYFNVLHAVVKLWSPTGIECELVLSSYDQLWVVHYGEIGKWSWLGLNLDMKAIHFAQDKLWELGWRYSIWNLRVLDKPCIPRVRGWPISKIFLNQMHSIFERLSVKCRNKCLIQAIWNSILCSSSCCSSFLLQTCDTSFVYSLQNNFKLKIWPYHVSVYQVPVNGVIPHGINYKHHISWGNLADLQDMLFDRAVTVQQ